MSETPVDTEVLARRMYAAYRREMEINGVEIEQRWHEIDRANEASWIAAAKVAAQHARTDLANAVYAAAVEILESLEGKGLLKTNGHHVAQEIVAVFERRQGAKP